MRIKKLNSLIGVFLLVLFGFNVENFAQKGKKPAARKPTTQANSKSSQGDKAIEAGLILFKKETQESLEAALGKFADAAALYYAANNKGGEANSYTLIGRANKKLNRFENAERAYRNALEMYDAINNSEGKAAALNNLGGVLRDLGKFNDALEFYQNALPLMRSTNNPKGEAQTMNGIGECYFALGNGEQSRQFFQAAYDKWQSMETNEDKVRTTFNMGRISFAYNDAQNGLNYLNKALNESRQFNNPVLEGDILEVLANYYLMNGELTKAIDYRKRIFDAYNNEKAWAVSVTRKLTSVNNLIVTYYRAGDFQSANQYLDRGISIGNKYNEKIATALLIGNKGVLQVDQGNYDEGIELLKQGIIASQQSNNKMTEAYFLASLAYAQSETGDNQQAIESLNQALRIVPAGSSPETEGKIISGLIKVYAEMENKGKTSEMIRLAASRKLDAGVNAGAVQVLAAAGYAEFSFGNSKEALRLLNQAYAIAAKLNHEVEKAKILYVGALVYSELKDYQNALQAVQTSHDFWKKIGNQSMDLETHYQMGIIYSTIDQYQPAIDQFNTVLGFSGDLGMEDVRASSHLFLGLIYLGGKNYQASIQHYNQAFTMFESLGDTNNQKTALNGISEAYEQSGDKKQAKTFRDKAKKIKN